MNSIVGLMNLCVFRSCAWIVIGVLCICVVIGGVGVGGEGSVMFSLSLVSCCVYAVVRSGGMFFLCIVVCNLILSSIAISCVVVFCGFVHF